MLEKQKTKLIIISASNFMCIKKSLQGGWLQPILRDFYIKDIHPKCEKELIVYH